MWKDSFNQEPGIVFDAEGGRGGGTEKNKKTKTLRVYEWLVKYECLLSINSMNDEYWIDGSVCVCMCV